MTFKETKLRSAFKAIGFRVLAFLNSFMILFFGPHVKPWIAALMMNCTGFVVLYFYERAWNKSKYGRIKDKNE